MRVTCRRLRLIPIYSYIYISRRVNPENVLFFIIIRLIERLHKAFQYLKFHVHYPFQSYCSSIVLRSKKETERGGKADLTIFILYFSRFVNIVVVHKEKHLPHVHYQPRKKRAKSPRFI